MTDLKKTKIPSRQKPLSKQTMVMC